MTIFTLDFHYWQTIISSLSVKLSCFSNNGHGGLSKVQNSIKIFHKITYSGPAAGPPLSSGVRGLFAVSRRGPASRCPRSGPGSGGG